MTRTLKLFFKFRFFLLLAALTFMSGCIRIDSMIYLNEDGSGSVEVTEMITGQGIDLLANLGKSGQIPNIDITDYFTVINETELAERANEVSEGIEFYSVAPIKLEDGSVGKKTTYKFKDINKVKLFSQRAKKRATIAFNYNNNRLNITTNLTEREEVEVMHRVKSLNNIPDGFKPAFSGMKFSIKLKTARPIASTNALFVSPNHKGITIIQVDVGKLISTPEAIEALSSYNRNTKERYQEVLEPFNNWLQVEYQKDLTVNFE